MMVRPPESVPCPLCGERKPATESICTCVSKSPILDVDEQPRLPRKVSIAWAMVFIAVLAYDFWLLREATVAGVFLLVIIIVAFVQFLALSCFE